METFQTPFEKKGMYVSPPLEYVAYPVHFIEKIEIKAPPLFFLFAFSGFGTKATKGEKVFGTLFSTGYLAVNVRHCPFLNWYISNSKAF